MAQIPLGNAGRAVPSGSVSMPSTGQAEANMALGRAVQGIGQTGMAIASDMQAQERAEAQRIQREEEHQRRVQAEKARVAAEQNHLNETDEALQNARIEFQEGVRNGTIDKAEAPKLWQERSTKIIADALPGFSDDVRDIAQKKVERLGRLYGREVQEAVTQRDRQDVTVGIDQTLEYAARRYMTDPQGAQEQVAKTLEALGPFSTYSPQQIAAKGQAWKERAQYNVALEAVNAGRHDRKALTAAEVVVGKLPDLDPKQRVELTSTIDAYRLNLDQKDLQRAQRAELEAQRRDRKAAQAWDTATKLSLTGTLTAEYAAQAARDMAGNPQYASAFKQLLERQRATGPLAAQSPAVLDQTLQQIDAKLAQGGTSPELKERRDQIAKVRDEQRNAINEDALGAALRYGKITAIPPLDMSTPQKLAASVLARVEVADITSTWTDKPESPLRPKEAEQLALQFKTLGPDEKAGAVAMVGAQLPADQRIALAKQMAPSDKGLYHALALGGGTTSWGVPAARYVFMGQRVLKEQGEKVTKAARIQQDVIGVVGDMVTGSVRDDVIEAASLIEMGRRADGQASAVKNSVQIAIGGPIIEHAGRKLPAAPGMTQDRFRDALAAQGRALAKKFPDGKVYTSGGEAMPAADFSADLVFSELQPAGLGRYYVRAGSGVALGPDGKPLVIEVK